MWISMARSWRSRPNPTPCRRRFRIAAAAALGREGEDLYERSVAVGFQQFAEASDHPVAHDDLRERHLARAADEVVPAARILGQADLFVGPPATLEQGLRLSAETAGLGRIDQD